MYTEAVWIWQSSYMMKSGFLFILMLSHHLVNGNHRYTEERRVPFDLQHQTSPASVAYSGHRRPGGVHINVRTAWWGTAAGRRGALLRQWQVFCSIIMEDRNGIYVFWEKNQISYTLWRWVSKFQLKFSYWKIRCLNIIKLFSFLFSCGPFPWNRYILHYFFFQIRRKGFWFT